MDLLYKYALPIMGLLYKYESFFLMIQVQIIEFVSWIQAF